MKADTKMAHDGGAEYAHLKWNLSGHIENGEFVSGFGLTPLSASVAFNSARAEALAFRPANLGA